MGRIIYGNTTIYPASTGDDLDSLWARIQSKVLTGGTLFIDQADGTGVWITLPVSTGLLFFPDSDTGGTS